MPVTKWQRRDANYLRQYQPTWRADKLSDIPATLLLGDDIRGILLDLDNTVVPWKSNRIPEENRAWITEMVQVYEMSVCLISNNLPHRPRKIAQDLQVDYIACSLWRGQWKPSPYGFRQALDYMSLPPNQVVMIGDQLLTDIRGANRCGIKTILVNPLSQREHWGTTLFNRRREHIFLQKLYARYGPLRDVITKIGS